MLRNGNIFLLCCLKHGRCGKCGGVGYSTFGAPGLDSYDCCVTEARGPLQVFRTSVSDVQTCSPPEIFDCAPRLEL